MAEGGLPEGGSKRVGLFIAVLALCLALVELGAKSTQTEALSANVESANLWSFFQARSIRQTILRTADESAALAAPTTPAAGAALERQRRAWRATAARWEDEPATGDGRRQLAQRARRAEAERSLAIGKYHQYELASAAFQVAIVVVSASIVVELAALAWVGAGVAGVGAVLGLLGWLAPGLLHHLL